MEETKQKPTTSSILFWAGWVLTVPVVLMLVFSAFMKFNGPPELAEGMGKLGWSIDKAAALGTVELISAVLYAIPQTAVLGAILLTGYLGGATATHVRIDDPFLTPVLLGVLLWLALFLRDSRLRKLVPWRNLKG